MKPSPYQISAFTEVARQRSFSRAAEVLGVTQSSITQHIANLERVMGAALFVRRRDGVELTQSARELYAVSDRLRSLEQQVHEMVAQYSTLSAGNLTIIANAPRPAMPILAKYTELHPQVQIDFSLCDWTTAMERLRAREADIAVVTEPKVHEGAQIIELARSPYVAYMREDHPLAAHPDVSLVQLSEETIIMLEDGSFSQSRVIEATLKTGVKLDRTVKMATAPVMKEAVQHGVGIGIFLGDSMYPVPGVVSRPIRELPKSFRHCLVTPRDRSNLRQIQSFVELAQGEDLLF